MLVLKSGLRFVLACAGIGLSALLSACGGGGGPAADPGSVQLPLMFDSRGQQVPEADFGRGDPLAAGADGVAFDVAPVANAEVTLSDNGGSTRRATTDAAGYYRFDIKNLQLPFIVKLRRADGSFWYSVGSGPAVTRGFVTINVNGLTDKTLGYVADAISSITGAASGVTPAFMNDRFLVPAKARLRTGLAVPLANAGLDAASYDPVSASPAPAAAERHAAFLRQLTITQNARGRTAVVAILAGLASKAAPSAPFRVDGIAVDQAGNAYVADGAYNVIRRVSPAGVISLFAGSGAAGFSDGDKAIASFNWPVGVAVDSTGNVYVTDRGNLAIRKISVDGTVTTLAGNGTRGLADGAGPAARFAGPQAVVVDGAGVLYVFDESNDSVRKITPDGVVTTIAGHIPGGPCCDEPRFFLTGLALDGAGNLYAAPLVNGNRVIRRITPSGVQSDIYVPTGDELRWFNPNAIAAATDGTVYATDMYTNRIHRISPDGSVTTLAGGPGGAIAVDGSGNVYVGRGGAIRKLAPNGDIGTLVGNVGGNVNGTAAAALFEAPAAVAVTSSGDILVADTGNDAIRRISRAGLATTFAGGPIGGWTDGAASVARFNRPTDVGIDRNGNAYVADSMNNAIRKISPEGLVSTLAGGGAAGFADGTGSAARFSSPTRLAVDRNGNVYVSDTGNVAVRKVTPAGVVTTLAGVGRVFSIAQLQAQDFSSVGPIAVDANGVVAFDGSCINGTYTRVAPCVFQIAIDGKVSRRLQPFSFNYLDGLSFDVAGNLDYGYGKEVLQLTPQGVETVLTSEPRFNNLGGVALDANGNIVIADRGWLVAVSSLDKVQRVPGVWIVLP